MTVYEDFRFTPTDDLADLGGPASRFNHNVKAIKLLKSLEAEGRHPGNLTPDEQLALTRRSEEHTSELQSLRHLVCRLLLEKKKHKTAPKNSHTRWTTRVICSRPPIPRRARRAKKATRRRDRSRKVVRGQTRPQPSSSCKKW